MRRLSYRLEVLSNEVGIERSETIRISSIYSGNILSLFFRLCIWRNLLQSRKVSQIGLRQDINWLESRGSFVYRCEDR